MTAKAYDIVMKALQKKKAEVRASPAAAKKFLIDRGLDDVLESAPIRQRRKVAVPPKAASKKSAS